MRLSLVKATVSVLLGVGVLVGAATSTAFAATKSVDVTIAVIRVDEPRDPPISRLDLPPKDNGLAGAELGQDDNATTGSFLGLNFNSSFSATTRDDFETEFDAAHDAGTRIFSLSAPADLLLSAVDRYDDILVMNATARDDALRGAQCHTHLLHVAPSYAMMADAMTQYMVWKDWKKWFLIHGSHDDDKAFAEAVRGSAHKFQTEIVEDREFTDTEGARRTDTGHVLVQKQIPVFTQGAAAHDVVVAADVDDNFATYLPYRTWDPRPVVGSAGLLASTWFAGHEAWGATQFQTRFENKNGRYAREEDYQNWLALRAIGEAATRTLSGDAMELYNYMLSPEFEVAGFKGEALSFRDWNGQMRQPILLTDRHSLVSVSPQEEYLHQFSRLDTLGFDRPENQCENFETN